MKIKIGSIIYTLKEYTIEDDKDGTHVSEIDLMENVIGIEPGLPESQKHQAILHESLHAMNWKMDENTVDFLAHAFYSYLVDNKELIKKMLKSETK